ncbi:DUF192 domain-containing protein [Halosimplex pelagicum]|uniref:DUF192 domain-containing protein n=1 Tax=Halosimplex pelagicum TaxID=869886 RepID=A0A7D5SVL4_9EURY|nr:DUF192 domain-containing protein [Halosimplex pelagicum]QLH82327.1 DUF192 domain-containing protein [Halosimplex pelagicum]
MFDSEPDSGSLQFLSQPPWKDVAIWAVGVLVLVLVASVVVVLLNPFGASPDVGETETVELVSGGEVVSTVTVETAVTKDEMETGLSNHESLPAGEGMLFFHSESGEQTYVMPDMDFGIDIVFIGDDCTVQAVRSADQPAPDESGYEPKHQHTADAKYVLEVPQSYASERISEGDTVRFAGGC